jgi:hypothetical protein
MRWDSTRPVPWKRLLTEWAVIGSVVAFVAYFITHNHRVGSYVGIVLAGGVYVGFGALFAKLGYVRKTLRQLRAEAANAPPRVVGRSASRSTSVRPRPAPTRRTSTGPSNRPQRKTR